MLSDVNPIAHMSGTTLPSVFSARYSEYCGICCDQTIAHLIPVTDFAEVVCRIVSAYIIPSWQEFATEMLSPNIGYNTARYSLVWHKDGTPLIVARWPGAIHTRPLSRKDIDDLTTVFPSIDGDYSSDAILLATEIKVQLNYTALGWPRNSEDSYKTPTTTQPQPETKKTLPAYFRRS